MSHPSAPGDRPLDAEIAAAPPSAPDPTLEAVVVIPARNEADLLPLALAALAGQVDGSGRPLDPRLFEVIVLANNCTDGTVAVGRELARSLTAGPPIHLVAADLPADRAHVGTARRWLMDRAAERLEAVGRPGGLILSTDADTVVAADWIAANRAEVADGAEAVAGLIEVDGGELDRLGPRARRAYWRDRVYRGRILQLEAMIDPDPLDPPPRHDFHGGASLAITVRMYRRVGGLPPLRCREDVALAEALWRAGARFVHSPRVLVRTSCRTTSRLDGGFGSELAARGGASSGSRVRAGAAIERELRGRSELRRLFRSTQPAGPAGRTDPCHLLALGEALGMPPESLTTFPELATYGLWFDAARALGWSPLSNDGEPVPIIEANRDLRRRVRATRSAIPSGEGPPAPVLIPA